MGYKEIGPEIPLEGPIYKSDIGRDLVDVISALEPHDDPEQVGTYVYARSRKKTSE